MLGRGVNGALEGIKSFSIWRFPNILCRSISRSQPATHSPMSVVLPKLAGAETRVSLRCMPPLRRSIRRGRRTALG